MKILTLKFPVDEIKKELEGIVLYIVSDRVFNIPTMQLKLQAFVCAETEKGTQFPDSLRNVFLNIAVEILSFSGNKVTNFVYKCP